MNNESPSSAAAPPEIKIELPSALERMETEITALKNDVEGQLRKYQDMHNKVIVISANARGKPKENQKYMTAFLLDVDALAKKTKDLIACLQRMLAGEEPNAVEMPKTLKKIPSARP